MTTFAAQRTSISSSGESARFAQNVDHQPQRGGVHAQSDPEPFTGGQDHFDRSRMHPRVAVCLNQRELHRQSLGQTLSLFDKGCARPPGAAGIQRAPITRSALAELSARANAPAELPAPWRCRQHRRLAALSKSCSADALRPGPKSPPVIQTRFIGIRERHIRPGSGRRHNDLPILCFFMQCSTKRSVCHFALCRPGFDRLFSRACDGDQKYFAHWACGSNPFPR